MAKEKKHLTAEHTARIISEWDNKTIEEFAAEFDVATNTVRSMVTAIRKKHPTYCPRKGRKTRDDIIDAAVRLLQEKTEDVVTDMN